MKYYIAFWCTSDNCSKGNKTIIHNFIDRDGEKCPVATKLRRIDGDTFDKISNLIVEGDKYGKR